mmetsp:Transcript_8753/g.27015  ORF Transcript_8753/g.27015 Transcript_8753/m.27015 type:complete len:226 (-) Transcript_8753:2-679(-)
MCRELGHPPWPPLHGGKGGGLQNPLVGGSIEGGRGTQTTHIAAVAQLCLRICAYDLKLGRPGPPLSILSISGLALQGRQKRHVVVPEWPTVHGCLAHPSNLLPGRLELALAHALAEIDVDPDEVFHVPLKQLLPRHVVALESELHPPALAYDPAPAPCLCLAPIQSLRHVQDPEGGPLALSRQFTPCATREWALGVRPVPVHEVLRGLPHTWRQSLWANACPSHA